MINLSDNPYCAADRYMKEYACLHRENVAMLSLDDKCKVNVGEPGTPVAAVGRGKRVGSSYVTHGCILL